MNKRFAVDLTIECETNYIEELFEKFCEQADDYGAQITQYRYYVPNEQESKRN